MMFHKHMNIGGEEPSNIDVENRRVRMIRECISDYTLDDGADDDGNLDFVVLSHSSRVGNRILFDIQIEPIDIDLERGAAAPRPAAIDPFNTRTIRDMARVPTPEMEARPPAQVTLLTEAQAHALLQAQALEHEEYWIDTDPTTTNG